MTSAGEVFVLHELVVDLDDEIQKIVDRLERGTKELDIVSIVGMPGLGKTTMARKVYSRISITYYFHMRLWCSVSQEFNEKSLLLQILSGLDADFANQHPDMTEHDLGHKIRQLLLGRRYLIILDDVWDTTAWNTLRSSFPNDSNGSRILLTSRNHELASQIQPNSEPHHLRSLTNDESWELLRKKMSFEDEVYPLGMEIAQLCKGLPLMIVVVAGILSNTEQDTWEEVAESLRQGIPAPITQQCKKSLELSYLHLPDHLKSCFLYFGAFQEDQQIPVREMLWVWIAEGIVEETGSECIEDVAEGFMIELIQRSLVMVSKKDSRGKIKSCVLHDLLLNFCKAKCKEEHFLYSSHAYELGTNSIEPSRLRRLHVHSKRAEDIAKSNLFCHHLHALFVTADYKESSAKHQYDILNKFLQSKDLRVLDLNRFLVGPLFPRLLDKFVDLRYLALAFVSCSKVTIPSSIHKLSNLEIFIVQGWGTDVLLPDTLRHMEKLRHLCITGLDTHWNLPEKTLKDHFLWLFGKHPYSLKNLETLSTVQFSDPKAMKEEMVKFPNIRRLRCELVSGKMLSSDKLALDFMSQLESLTIFQHYNRYDHFHFEFSHNLKKLVMSCFQLPWSQFSAIGKLPNLEVLKLLCDAFVGETWEMEEGTFPKLRYLTLADLDLREWTTNSDGGGDFFPCLEKLELESCLSLTEVPSCLSDVSTLQMIQVSNCKSVIGTINQIKNDDIITLISDSRLLLYSFSMRRRSCEESSSTNNSPQRTPWQPIPYPARPYWRTSFDMPRWEPHREPMHLQTHHHFTSPFMDMLPPR